MIEPGDDLASIIYNNIIDNNIKIDDGDVIAVAQKVISKAENRYRSLDEIVPSEDAKELANQIDKDPQFVQAVLDESAAPPCRAALRGMRQQSDRRENCDPLLR